MKKFFCITLLLFQVLIYLPTIVLADEPTSGTGTTSGTSGTASGTGTSSGTTSGTGTGGTGSTTTSTQPDEDQDGIPNTNDNCPRTKNPNQTNKNNNTIGDACDTEYQNQIRRNLEDSITFAENSIIDTARTTPTKDNKSFGYSCLANLPSQGQPACTGTPPANIDEKFTTLYNALQNKQILSVLEEPLSTENIFNRAQICTTKYLRDKNGFLKFTNLNLGEITLDFDNPNLINDGEVNLTMTPEGQIYLQALENNNNLKVGIAVDKCETKYVQQCTPSFSYIREVKFGDPLPTIVTCDRVQILFGNSGIDLLKQYVGLVYRWATGIVGIIAVFIIMIQGVIIATAGGDDSKIGEAKTKIIGSLSAIAILFLSGIILYTINPNYFTATNLQQELEEIRNNPPTPSSTPTSEPPTPSTTPPGTPSSVPGQEDGQLPTV